MRRSCFNIISCGCINQSKDIDDINISSQNKGPDKSGWSSRKKSPRREAPSNTVVKDTISSIDNKEITEPITTSSEPNINSNVCEKTSDGILTKEIQISATEPVCIEDDINHEHAPEKSETEYESAALVIQAAIRRFLAERHLVKHKNVVKLQAAVRGHLVRNHAVGTLRCVQAIVKMQALVRAHREKGVQNAGIINSNPTHVSIEKLLSNRLARQLLESTPKTKQINIKCDPLKSDSAWNWLERWMSVSSPETLQPHTPDHDQDKAVNNTEDEVKTVISKPVSENLVLNTESNLIPENPVSETEPEPIPQNPVSYTEPETIPENPVSETKPEPISENPVSETVPEISVSETKPEPIPENAVSETKPEPVPENAVSETKSEPIPENPVSKTEPKHAAKQTGSRKASNPSFIAAQSKFEELTSLTNPLKSPGSSKQGDEPGSVSGSPTDIGSLGPLKPAIFSTQDDVAGCGSVEPRDDLVNHGSRVVQTGSECGTELSITSTLDSPDQFEIENTKFEEADTSINNDSNNNNSNSSSDDNNNNNNIGVVTPEKQVNQKPNNIEPEPEPESSHITNLESQGTPSSQLSTASKKTRTDKKLSGQTRKSWSASKKSSTVSSSVDSGLRTSLDQLPKESKPRKQRNVFGSPKRDHIDGEPVVPGYMQATESARAKAVANISPRSSPDLKKRHSLPGPGNDRHGSPRIQRSPSQALQTTKGNGNQERKWQI